MHGKKKIQLLYTILEDSETKTQLPLVSFCNWGSDYNKTKRAFHKKNSYYYILFSKILKPKLKSLLVFFCNWGSDYNKTKRAFHKKIHITNKTSRIY
jgi:hypothetical protein